MSAWLAATPFSRQRFGQCEQGCGRREANVNQGPEDPAAAGFYFLALALNAGPADVGRGGRVVGARAVAAEEIAALIAREFAAWNARDLDGYMAVFWHSPQLLYLEQESVRQG